MPQVSQQAACTTAVNFCGSQQRRQYFLVRRQPLRIVRGPGRTGGLFATRFQLDPISKGRRVDIEFHVVGVTTDFSISLPVRTSSSPLPLHKDNPMRS